jgi:peptidoglycan/LPS O-acetylase OafA/YrhL
MTSQPTPATPVTAGRKPHFAVFDGLRGVAALLVVIHHSGEPQLMPSGHLAVDFFFILSGFVVSYAYDDRLAKGLSFAAFARLRLIRLYPMIALGVLLGALINHGLRFTPAADIWVIPDLLFIPNLGRNFYPFDPVQWTLALEIGINLVHALAWRLITTRRLMALVGLAGAALLFIALRRHTLDVGWGLENWWGGIVRVCFGYGLGMLLYRLHASGRLAGAALPFAAAAIALTAVILGCGFAPQALKGAAEFIAVAALFPLILMACVRTRPGAAWMGQAVTWLGLISYPIYAVHMPIMKGWVMFTQGQGSLPGRLIPFGAAMAVAVLAAVFYDRPVRRWLSARFASGPQAQPAETRAG